MVALRRLGLRDMQCLARQRPYPIGYRSTEFLDIMRITIPRLATEKYTEKRKNNLNYLITSSLPAKPRGWTVYRKAYSEHCVAGMYSRSLAWYC